MLALEMIWHLLCGMMVSPTILATTKIASMSIRIQILMFKANGTIGAAITKQDLFAKLPLLLLKSNSTSTDLDSFASKGFEAATAVCSS